MLLTIVSGDNRNLLGWVSDEPHVHVRLYEVLGLAKILIEVGIRAEFTPAFVIFDIDQLVFAREACVRSLELWLQTKKHTSCSKTDTRSRLVK